MAAKRPQQQPTADALTGAEIVEVTQVNTAVSYTASTISAAASDNSFNDAASQFVIESFAVGAGLKSTGFTGTVGNNSDKCVIVSVTAGKIVVSGVTLVDDAAGESVTLTQLETRRSTTQGIADLAGAAANLGAAIHAATGKTTPVDADEIPISDSAASWVLKKLTWANLKATLKTYTDTLYALLGAVTGSGLTMATARLLGRTTASTGAVEEITVGTGLSLSAGSLAIGDAELLAIAGLTSAADKGIQFTGSGTAAVFDLTAAGKALLDDAAASNQRETLRVGLVPIYFACSDLTTALTTGTTKGVAYNPYATAFNVVEVFAALATAQTSGSTFTVDINEGAGAGTTILSTKLTIDNGDLTGGNGSGTASATPAVVSDASIAAFGRLTVDIDQVGDGTAKGLMVCVLGYPSA